MNAFFIFLTFLYSQLHCEGLKNKLPENSIIIRSNDDIVISEDEILESKQIILETTSSNAKITVHGKITTNNLTIKSNFYEQTGSVVALKNNMPTSVKILAEDIQLSGNALIDLSETHENSSIWIGTENMEKKGFAAKTISIGNNVILSTKQINDAGNIVIWSTEKTDVNGTIEANSLNGNGGFVEVSSKKNWLFPNWLNAVDVSGRKNGTFLIDPNDIIITTSGGSSVSGSPINANIIDPTSISSYSTLR